MRALGIKARMARPTYTVRHLFEYFRAIRVFRGQTAFSRIIALPLLQNGFEMKNPIRSKAMQNPAEPDL